ncbi:hypothetical protein EMIT0P2_100188 [Pseudomonas sp. IT-P2]
MQQLPQIAGLAQLQRDFADDGAQHFRAPPHQFKGVVDIGRTELVGLGQMGVEVQGVRLGELFPQQRKGRDARAEKRLALAQYQVGEFVAIGTGEHQMQPAALAFTPLIELIPCGLQGKHCVNARCCGECVLGLVDHQHYGFFGGAVEQFQCLRQGRAGRQLRLGEIPGQGAQKAEFFDADILRQFADAPFKGDQRTCNGTGDQVSRVFFLIGPQVDVNRQPASGLAFRDQILAQKGTFACATRRSQKKTGGEILQTCTHQTIGNAAGQSGAAEDEAVVSGHGFTLNYSNDCNLYLKV